jgi:hypothetical protein
MSGFPQYFPYFILKIYFYIVKQIIFCYIKNVMYVTYLLPHRVSVVQPRAKSQFARLVVEGKESNVDRTSGSGEEKEKL